MFPEKGFSFTQKGTNSGIFVPVPSINNMFTNERYSEVLMLINRVDDLTLLMNALWERAYQEYNIDKEKMFFNFMMYSLFNNISKINKQLGDMQAVLSNSNTIYSIYPALDEYPESERIKVSKYLLEDNILQFIHNILVQSPINRIQIKEVFLELLIVLRDKNRNFVSNNPICLKIVELKQSILNNEELYKIYQAFNDNKIFINVNKQGTDGKNNIYYHVPVYLSEKAKQKRDLFKIEDCKQNLPAILETSISSIHPVFLKNIEKLAIIDSVDLFKVIYWYKHILKNYEVKCDNIYEFILDKLIKFDNTNGFFVTIKNIRKEIEMKTSWFDVGRQFSVGVYQMHNGKREKELFKAIASTKEELVNTISMRKPSDRSDILIKKYIVKFGLSLESTDPEGLLEMTDIGLKEFILGLYLKINKKEEV